MTTRCVVCARVATGDTRRFMTIDIGSRRAALLRLFACMDTCIDDPAFMALQDAIADSMRLPEGSAEERETLIRGVETFRAATLARHGMARMPEVWSIPRDDPRPRVTLRNRRRWGLVTPR